MQGKALTPEQEEELLSKLIMADFSLKKAQALLEQIKEKGNNVDVIREVLLNEAPPFEPLRDTSVPSVFFIIGVNGVGKNYHSSKVSTHVRKTRKERCRCGCRHLQSCCTRSIEHASESHACYICGWGAWFGQAVPFFTRPFQRTRRRLFFLG